ncbi:radical SAM protein [Sorangium cellulosum]|uniref:radical SAM protein n=1 Tax=Sorangium cellulosum TaxID=56 RepID=UPI003D9A663F
MKPSEFNVFVDAHVDGVVIAYNTFTGSMLTCDAGELARVEAALGAPDAAPASARDAALRERLVACGFLVADGLDERRALRSRYDRRQASTGAVALTLAPTVSCNFGCTYCFQEHPKRRMSEDDVLAVKRHVAGNLGPGSSLHVTWFGGEPLLAFDVIEELTPYFHEIAGERGGRFRQSMITNGSLLDEQKADFFAAQGNFDFLQITLDGPPAVHNKRRLTTNGQPTYDRILANVERASGRLPITLRVNVDRSNVDHLAAFVDLLAARGLLPRVSVYLGHVLPYTDVCSGVGSAALTKEEFAAVQASFDFALFERGIRPPFSLPKPRFGNLCIADNPRGAVVAPDGLVFRCWNEVATTEREASGLLAPGSGAVVSEGSARENRAAWDGYDPFAHAVCQTCKVQPLCHGGCPWEARKNPVESTGHCTPLRWNLPDRLRLVHLKMVLDKHPPIAADGAAPGPC